MDNLEKKDKIRKMCVSLTLDVSSQIVNGIDDILENEIVSLDEWEEGKDHWVLPKCIVLALLEKSADSLSGKGTRFYQDVIEEIRRIKSQL